MITRKKIFLVSFLLTICTLSFGQEVGEQNSSLQDKVYFGGSFGAWFSESYSFVEVSPLVGYRITPKLSSGGGIIYQYIRQKYYSSGGREQTYSTSVYGGRLFSRMDVYEPFFLYGEFEDVSYKYYNTYLDQFRREWVPGLFLGGGIVQPFGRKGGVTIMVLYNFLYDSQKSPYNDAFVYRVSFFL